MQQNATSYLADLNAFSLCRRNLSLFNYWILPITCVFKQCSKLFINSHSYLFNVYVKPTERKTSLSGGLNQWSISTHTQTLHPPPSVHMFPPSQYSTLTISLPHPQDSTFGHTHVHTPKIECFRLKKSQKNPFLPSPLYLSSSPTFLFPCPGSYSNEYPTMSTHLPTTLHLGTSSSYLHTRTHFVSYLPSSLTTTSYLSFPPTNLSTRSNHQLLPQSSTPTNSRSPPHASTQRTSLYIPPLPPSHSVSQPASLCWVRHVCLWPQRVVVWPRSGG